MKSLWNIPRKAYFLMLEMPRQSCLYKENTDLRDLWVKVISPVGFALKYKCPSPFGAVMWGNV